MTLKSTFICDPAVGLQKSLVDAYAAGKAFVATNYSILEDSMEAAAVDGKTTFSVSVVTLYKESSLRLRGELMNVYFAGIYSALGDNHIFYPSEVKLILSTPSQSETRVQFDFTF